MDTNMDRQLAIRTDDLLALSDVHRWTVIRTGRRQSVAEHAFAVAVIAMELADRLLDVGVGGDGIDRLVLERDILWWAITHDAPEILTGDVDGRFKLEFPDVAEGIREAEGVAFPWYKGTRDVHASDDRVKWIVKVADKVEGIMYIRQWGVGARADGVYHELVEILNRDTIPKLAAALAGPPPMDEVYRTVNMVMNRILSQAFNYQSRNRKASEITEANRV